METAHCLPIPKGKPNLGTAVALMDTGLDSKVKGVVRFVQVDDSTCVVDGTLDGLLPGKYGVYLHEFGDISAGCNSCGDILGKSLNKPVGEIGEITSTAGRAEFRVTNNNFKVWDIIGRSCVLHDQAQLTDNRHSQQSEQTIGKNRQKDLCKVWDIIGRSCVLHDQAQSTDNRLLCGIVARSAGLFQNTKRICACDGVPVWDERDTPVAGPSRKSKI
ncbi:copper chaperone for superoxide dismutase [Mytilus galloprovincialis]|uniref:Copper chaperone for superoxide dismutase n=1 Tax=Mytilus galloprovincialis TaxID=29158 RepID=A0A8B6FL86_MYTGA|nr:copper chaperone for superoxide dismutase [Mytilus galloprovincialis]